MVGPDGTLPLPWLAGALRDGMKRQGHALLVQGPEGVGQFELAVTLAQAWLCEVTGAAGVTLRPCGTCAACRLVQARSHPDLLVLLPEALRDGLGWNLGNAEGEEGGGGKSKQPSKEIKVDAVRAAVGFAQTTSARGRGKVVVVHPAGRMNAVAANTLLKTLEEPPGTARFLLCGSSGEALLPTLRSRCQLLPLSLPTASEAASWLSAEGVAEPEVVLAACGGQPLLARQWAAEGIGARIWLRVPAALCQGDAGAFTGWPLPRLVDALQKVCHDALCVAVGTAPRYFPLTCIPAGPSVGALTAWSKSLQRIARHVEHPWSAGLLVEALVDEASHALDRTPAKGRGPATGSLHFRP